MALKDFKIKGLAAKNFPQVFNRLKLKIWKPYLFKNKYISLKYSLK